MARKLKVFFAGEGIYMLTSIYKGRDSFSMGSYFEHGKYFIKAVRIALIDYIAPRLLRGTDAGCVLYRAKKV